MRFVAFAAAAALSSGCYAGVVFHPLTKKTSASEAEVLGAARDVFVMAGFEDAAEEEVDEDTGRRAVVTEWKHVAMDAGDYEHALVVTTNEKGRIVIDIRCRRTETKTSGCGAKRDADYVKSARVVLAGIEEAVDDFAAFADALVPLPDDLSDEAVYGAAARVLASRNEGVRDRFPEAGILVTEWKTVRFPVGKVHHSWRVMVAGRQLTIGIDCQVLPFKATSYIDRCPSARRARTYVAEVEELREAILAEARRATEER